MYAPPYWACLALRERLVISKWFAVSSHTLVSFLAENKSAEIIRLEEGGVLCESRVTFWDIVLVKVRNSPKILRGRGSVHLERYWLSCESIKRFRLPVPKGNG